MPENDERIEEYNTSRDLGPVMGFGGRLPLINPDGPRDFGIVRGLRRIVNGIQRFFAQKPVILR